MIYRMKRVQLEKPITKPWAEPWDPCKQTATLMSSDKPGIEIEYDSESLLVTAYKKGHPEQSITVPIYKCDHMVLMPVEAEEAKAKAAPPAKPAKASKPAAEPPH